MPRFRWATAPPGLLFVLLCVGGLTAVTLPQLVAVLILAPDRLAGSDRFGLFTLLALWGKADPSELTGAAVAGGWHWGIVATMYVVFIGVIVTMLVARARRKSDPQMRPGLAPPGKVVRELGTRQLLKVWGPRLRPSVQNLRASQVGFRVGTYFGQDVWLRVEDPTIVIGPSRSGKGWNLVLGWILDAPGAVITTSSKMDNAALTMREKQRQGSRVWVFAPGIEGGQSLGHVLKWNPIEGCVDERTLVRRVKALVPSDAFSGSTSNGGHWDTIGQQLAAHLFHAAACAGAYVDTVWDWVSSAQKARNAVQAIRSHPEGLLEHAAHLEYVLDMPPEQRTNAWGVLPTVLAFLESRIAREWMKPDASAAFDPVRFTLASETLYLVGDKQSTGGYVRIIDGLLAELDYVTKALADASPGTRIDPPVSYILDEAGNFEYQGLYELVTAGGGRGRVGIAVFQSKDQLGQWGQEVAGTLWDAATAKILLPGGGDSRALREISDLVGEMWVSRESHSFGAGPGSVQVSEERRSVLEGSEIREQDAGYGFLFYRNMKPIIPKFIPFSGHPRYSLCAKDAAEIAGMLEQSSPFAAAIAEYREKNA